MHQRNTDKGMICVLWKMEQCRIRSSYSTKTQLETEIGYFWHSNLILFQTIVDSIP